MKTKTILKNATLTYFGENRKYAGHTISADIELGMNECSYFKYWICSLTKGIEFEKSTLRGMDYTSTEDGITSTTFDFMFENIEQWETVQRTKQLFSWYLNHQKETMLYNYLSN